MPDLSALIERLEMASGSDREIDCLLWAIQEGIELEWQGTTLVAGTVGVIGWCDPGATARNFYTNRDVRGPGSIPALTASIDAAVAFKERVLPGWAWAAGLDGGWPEGRQGWARVFPWPNLQHLGSGNWNGATAPIALLIATLRALQATRGGDR